MIEINLRNNMQNSASTLTSLPAPSEHDALITAEEKILYNYLSEENVKSSHPISKDKKEKKSYEKLCFLRRSLSETYEIPNPWRLNERGCPRIKLNSTSIGHLKCNVKKLKDSDYPPKMQF